MLLSFLEILSKRNISGYNEVESNCRKTDEKVVGIWNGNLAKEQACERGTLCSSAL